MQIRFLDYCIIYPVPIVRDYYYSSIIISHTSHFYSFISHNALPSTCLTQKHASQSAVQLLQSHPNIYHILCGCTTHLTFHEFYLGRNLIICCSSLHPMNCLELPTEPFILVSIIPSLPYLFI